MTEARSRTDLGLSLGLAAGAVLGLSMGQRRRAIATSPFRQGHAQRTALITGASSGIGECYARQLARRGYNVILVARREARLQALAAELSRQYAVQAEVLVADLTDAADVARVEARIAETDTLEILVNNAGFGTAGAFIENEIASQDAMIRIHATTATRLTHAALQGMLARRCGAIVNVASMVAFYPVAGSATYSGVKAYLKGFSEALCQEVAGTGVRMQVLCPGFTRTEFQKAGHIDEVGVPDFLWLSPETVVTQSLRDLDAGRVISVPGVGYRLLAILAGLIPRPLLYQFGYWIRRYRAASMKRFEGFDLYHIGGQQEKR